MVYEEDDGEVPDKILEKREEAEENANNPLFLVRFYDKRRNWYAPNETIRTPRLTLEQAMA